ncbi:MAG: hypothetical protein F6K40_18205 [Okeania sp. SIO3I5]|uniref:hypothetical protein n=1 Tax=Okeania sp. SIO3I5 TaxID=2607805 RepID=UPI0013BA4C29|nr:hypothetical protein [Okeania sp. SIO3I5]NEQ38090.1 hypothetical protein [Okeania sp. SIO3I5]
MNPIRGYTMLNFLEWLQINYPQITSLRNIPENQLLDIVDQFEGGKLKNNNDLITKWRLGFDYLFTTSGDWKGYDRARKKLNIIEMKSNNLIQKFKKIGANVKNINISAQDFLERYKKVPLHSLFLYTSEDKYIFQYILENWGALDTISGEYCDIYPNLEQFQNLEDAYEYIENFTVLKRIEFMDYSKLPGLFFWDNNGDTEYISLQKTIDSNDIKIFIRTIFEEIRKKPIIASVSQAKEKLIQKEFSLLSENYFNLVQYLNCD